jgi:hypothetical protein
MLAKDALEAESERAAISPLRRHCQITAQTLSNALANVQPQSIAIWIHTSAFCRVSFVEGLEKVLDLFVCHSDPLVNNMNLNVCKLSVYLLFFDIDTDNSTNLGELGCI